MRIPRDLNSRDLIKLLLNYGYTVSRQSGSHIRLTTDRNGQHHITIPYHDPLKIGTLAAIIGEVAGHFNMTKQDLLQEFFG